MQQWPLWADVCHRVRLGKVGFRITSGGSSGAGSRRSGWITGIWVAKAADSADSDNRTIGSGHIEHVCLTCRNLTIFDARHAADSATFARHTRPGSREVTLDGSAVVSHFELRLTTSRRIPGRPEARGERLKPDVGGTRPTRNKRKLLGRCLDPRRMLPL